MEFFYSFIQTVSPLGVIAILCIIIFQLVDGKKLMQRIRGTQQDRENIQTGTIITLATLNGKIDKVMGNHLHELPEMKASIDRIESTVNELKDNFGNRLTRVETIIENK